MRKPPHVVDIFLQPGDWYFGDRDTRVRTLLGSCVAITLWHPRHLVGGMCHYMLPSRPEMRPRAEDGRYADEAFALLMREVNKVGTRIDEYQIKMFGGGNMFPGGVRYHQDHVGSKNATAGHRLIESHGLSCTVSDLGGLGHRNVIFDIWSGNVWVRRQKLSADAEMQQEQLSHHQRKSSCRE